MMMAGSLHPPFSLFLPEEKEKTGRARSKREKEGTTLRGDGRRRTRKMCLRFLRKSPVRGVVQAGVLEVEVRLVRLSSLPLTWRFRWSCAYRFFFPAELWKMV